MRLCGFEPRALSASAAFNTRSTSSGSLQGVLAAAAALSAAPRRTTTFAPSVTFREARVAAGSAVMILPRQRSFRGVLLSPATCSKGVAVCWDASVRVLKGRIEQVDAMVANNVCMLLNLQLRCV